MVLFPTNQANNNIVHIYAPTGEADEQVKEEFYMRLQDIPDKRNKHDLMIVTGDMNATCKMGEENWDYERVMGKHGLGQQNDDGEGFCELCDMLSYHRNTLPT